MTPNDTNRNNAQNDTSREDSGDMSVREAGHKGGQRVRELVEEGKESEGQGGRHQDNQP